MFRTLFRSRRSAPDLTEAQVLDALAAAAGAEADDIDAALTPARAAAQRDAILARLSGDADSRVLSFPPRPDDAGRIDGTPAPRAGASGRPALHWLLTAAAAGLVVGVGTGHGIYSELEDPTAPATVRTAVRSVPAPVPITAELDEQVLGQVEVVLAGRGVEELRPLDALTPTAVSLLASAGR